MPKDTFHLKSSTTYKKNLNENIHDFDYRKTKIQNQFLGLPHTQGQNESKICLNKKI